MFITVIFISVFCFALYRNSWTYEKRVDVLNQSLEAYDNLPSYDYMLLHFWVWDVDKFINK